MCTEPNCSILTDDFSLTHQICTSHYPVTVQPIRLQQSVTLETGLLCHHTPTTVITKQRNLSLTLMNGANKCWLVGCFVQRLEHMAESRLLGETSQKHRYEPGTNPQPGDLQRITQTTALFVRALGTDKCQSCQIGHKSINQSQSVRQSTPPYSNLPHSLSTDQPWQRSTPIAIYPTNTASRWGMDPDVPVTGHHQIDTGSHRTESRPGWMSTSKRPSSFHHWNNQSAITR